MSGEERRRRFGCGLRVICKSIFRSHSNRKLHSGKPGLYPYFSVSPDEPLYGAGSTSIPSPNGCRSSGEATTVKPLTASSQVHAGQRVDRLRQKQVPGAPGVKTGTEIVQVQKRSTSITRGLVAELESFIFDHQRTRDSSFLVRASSGNGMMLSILGNLRLGSGHASAKRDTHGGQRKQQEADERAVKRSSLPRQPLTLSSGKELLASTQQPSLSSDKQLPALTQPPTVSSAKELSAPPQPPTSPSAKDPAELKKMGDEEYKKGKFEEAVALYDQAMALGSNKAACRTRKAAALMPLGRLLEAVVECREALSADPAYHSAHYRLANLYRRLGEGDKAKHHYSLAGTKTSSKDLEQASRLRVHVRKANDAQRLRDWNTLLREAQSAISSGADSAPQIFSAQAEALLKLQRPQEADTLLTDAPIFDTSESVKFYGARRSSYILSVRAQVDMSMGRFDEAVSIAQKAIQVDPYSKDAKAVLRRTQAVATSRSRGNELFKDANFSEACVAYSDGLGHDLNNPVLLCDRAACRMKLGQWKKAIKDCNLALQMRPSYDKARLRRADCYTKLEQFGASLEDYKVLMQEMPEDEEVMKGFSNVQYEIEKRKTINGGKNDESNVITIKSNKQFMQIIEEPASVVLFSDKSSNTAKTQIMEQLSQRYTSIKFLRVDKEDLPYIVKQEQVNSIPSFRVYRKGSMIKDSAAFDKDQLEKLIRCLRS